MNIKFLKTEADKIEAKMIKLNEKYEAEMMSLIAEYSATKCELEYYDIKRSLSSEALKIIMNLAQMR